MLVLACLVTKISQLLLGMRSSNKHYMMSKWGIFIISKFKFSYDKYSAGKFWTKIYCQFYFRGITLRYSALAKLEPGIKNSKVLTMKVLTSCDLEILLVL